MPGIIISTARRLGMAALIAAGVAGYAGQGYLATMRPAAQAQPVTCSQPAGNPGQWRSAYPDGPVYVCDASGAWVRVRDLSK